VGGGIYSDAAATAFEAEPNNNRDGGIRRRQSRMVAFSLPPLVPSARGHVFNFALRLNDHGHAYEVRRQVNAIRP